jgi:hypothetical protein
MKKSNLFIGMFLIMSINLFSTNYNTGDYHSKVVDTTIIDIRFCSGFTHQPQDFFIKAFSFHRIKTDFISKDKVILDGQLSTFVTNPKVELNNETAYFPVAQAEIFIGLIYRNRSKISLSHLVCSLKN